MGHTAVAAIKAPLHSLHLSMLAAGPTAHHHDPALYLRAGEGHTYVARFTTRVGYLTVRLPWTSFRPTQEGLPPLNPEAITHIGIRFEARRAGVVAGKAGGTSAPRPPSALSEVRPCDA